MVKGAGGTSSTGLTVKVIMSSPVCIYIRHYVSFMHSFDIIPDFFHYTGSHSNVTDQLQQYIGVSLSSESLDHHRSRVL